MKTRFVICIYSTELDSFMYYVGRGLLSHSLKNATQFETYSDTENAIKIVCEDDNKNNENYLYQIEKIFYHE